MRNVLNFFESMSREGEGNSGGAAPAASTTPAATLAAGAPAPTPSTPSTPTSLPVDPTSPVDSPDERPEGDEGFEGLGLEVVEIEPGTAEPDAPATSEATTPAAPAEGATPPLAEAAPVVPPAEPATPAAAPSPQEPSASEAGPSLPLADPAHIAAAFEANQTAMIEALSKEYALTEEEAVAFETDPVKALPKLAATVALRVQTNMLRQLQQIVPAMMQRYTTVTSKSKENQSKFYETWPSLKDPKFSKTVTQIAVTYRQMNPETSLDEMIKNVGPMAMMALGLPVTPAAAAPAVPQGTPTGLQRVGNGTAPVFSPAIAGPTPTIPAAPAPDEWGGLGVEYEN